MQHTSGLWKPSDQGGERVTAHGRHCSVVRPVGREGFSQTQGCPTSTLYSLHVAFHGFLLKCQGQGCRCAFVCVCVCRVSLMTREVKGEKNTCLHSSLINYPSGDAPQKITCCHGYFCVQTGRINLSGEKGLLLSLWQGDQSRGGRESVREKERGQCNVLSFHLNSNLVCMWCSYFSRKFKAHFIVSWWANT